MNQGTPDLILDTPPDADIILMLREQAQQAGESVIATFDDEHRNPRYLIVSDRGTCVLLDEHVAIRTFNRELDAQQVARGLVGEA